MRNIRKVVSILMVLCIVIFGFASQSYAENLSDNLVQFDEFITKVGYLCEKHGISVEVVESENFRPISRIELEKYLKTLKEQLKSTADTSIDVVYYIKDIYKPENNNGNTVTPKFMMPVTKDFTTLVEVRGRFAANPIVPARVDILAWVNATYCANRRDVLSINYTDYYGRDSVNLERINNCDFTHIRIENGIGFRVDGRASFIYTDPWLGYTIRTTEPFTQRQYYFFY